MFIEDLIDYKNHEGYAKLHQRRNNFCTLNKRESWRILIGKTNHNSFLDTNYFLEDDDAEKEKAHNVLHKTVVYMDAFFAHHLKSEQMYLDPILSDSLEIFHFKK